MLQDLLQSMRVVALPTKSNFRGVSVREVALFKGEFGWGEFSPFLEYDATESAPYSRNGENSPQPNSPLNNATSRRDTPRKFVLVGSATTRIL